MDKEPKIETEETSPSPKPEKGKVDLIAIFSYVGILCLVPLFTRQDDPFVKFHAKQGLVLFIAEIITSVFSWIPFIGWYFAPLLWIIWIILSIIGIMNVMNSKKKPLPVIGQFAKKFKI